MYLGPPPFAFVDRATTTFIWLSHLGGTGAAEFLVSIDWSLMLLGQVTNFVCGHADARGVVPNNSLQSGQDSGAGECEPNPDPTYRKESTTPNKEQLPSLSSDSDDYSNKLDKDAQVWKVYVNETDKHDAELVNSWNDSTDVILIFAALFSAISTAFIIESTKLLQPDPAEESAQSLRAISQTLASIANTSQPPGSARPLVDDIVEFTPSRSALAVNILWYLSLSLSLATSFIAILAKDWCHSFISGRSGHPYAQARRRQQKWAMIEKWRMSELLTVLPSLVHVALVLFSIGLCIHLWDINALVAVPVISVLAIAFAFYVASSVAATILEHFPYPTIVSRLCRTEPMRWIYQQALWIIAQFVPWIATQFVFGLVALRYIFFRLCAGIVRGVLILLIYFIIGLGLLALYISQVLDHVSELPPLLYLAGILLGPILVVLTPFVIFMTRMASNGTIKEVEPKNIYQSLKDAINGIPWHFGPRPPRVMPTERPHTNNPRHDMVTSQALGWLIKNCEVPQSVDVALQSIASINKQFPRRPLEECNATLEILRRLASSDLYRTENAHATMKLYSQALSTLGPPIDSQKMDDHMVTQPTTVENLETTIWDLQALAEKNLVELITDGGFQADSHNLEALRIGSTFAPHSLKLLKSSPSFTSPQIGSIVNMLEKHLDHDEAYLHQSTLFLLTNVAIVLGLISADDSALTIRKICRRLAHKEHSSYSPQLKAALATSVLLQRRETCKDASRIEDLAETGRRLSILIDWQSASQENSKMLHEVALLELLCVPSCCFTSGLQLEHPAPPEEGKTLDMKSYNEASVHRLWISDPLRHSSNSKEYRNEKPVAETVLPYLQAFHSVYSVIKPETMRPHVYVFVLECMSLLSPPASLITQCGLLLDILPIPEPSGELIRSMKGRDIISKLQEATKFKDSVVQKFFAASQLWLFHVLQQSNDNYTPDDIDIMALRGELGIEDGDDDVKIQEPFVKLVADTWNASNSEIVTALGLYAYRLMESLYQSSKHPVPPSVNSGLQGTPEAQRGLSAMLARTLPSTAAQAHPEIQYEQASENQGGDRLSNSAKGKARATNPDTEELGITGS